MVVGSSWNVATGLSRQARDRVVEGLGTAKNPGLVTYREWARAMAWAKTEAKTKL